MLEIVRNAENKYLPRTFTMNFFETATGKLQNTIGFENRWQRVRRFDLPERILEIASRDGRMTTREILCKNCRLTTK